VVQGNVVAAIEEVFPIFDEDFQLLDVLIG
jgi:hypothetical protein